MFEAEAICRILAGMPRSPRQRNAPFAADAELLEIGAECWAVTTDDFSPAEDLLITADWRDLGRILTVATLSDLAAVGADPCFFLQALSLPRDTSEAELADLAAGAREVLDAAGAFLIGGDLGTADPWRFCGTAMGVVSGRPLTRVLPAIPQTLWVTGSLGDAAVAALIDAPTPLFELRLQESRIFREDATGCTDTSGGLFRSLWDFLEVSPAVMIEIDRESLPLAPAVQQVLGARGIPAEAALLAGAGEYELVFATPESLSESCRRAFKDAGCTSFGRVLPGGKRGVRLLSKAGATTLMTAPPPDPRAVADVSAHVAEVVAQARELFP